MRAFQSHVAFVCWVGCFATAACYHDRLSTSPREMSGLFASEQVVGLAIGLLHSCAVYQSGTVRCRGSNDLGELGFRGRSSSTSPVVVSGVSDVVELGATTAGTTCARSRSGRVWCWGSNLSGAIGNGHHDDDSCAADVFRPLACHVEPSLVPTIPPAKHLVVGDSGVCVLGVDDSVWCWGGTRAGSRFVTASPTLIGRYPSVRGISMLRDDPVITLADGRIVTTGAFSMRTLGPTDHLASHVSETEFCIVHSDRFMECVTPDGGERDPRAPRPREAADPRETEVVAVAVGPYHRCSLLSSGRVRCHGSNHFGETGGIRDHERDADASTEATVSSEVQNLAGVTTIAVGGFTSCAIRSDHSVWCWGKIDGIATHLPREVTW